VRTRVTNAMNPLTSDPDLNERSSYCLQFVAVRNCRVRSYIYTILQVFVGVRGGAVGLRHYATSRKVAGSIPYGVIVIFH
jgi:hypothetical protein